MVWRAARGVPARLLTRPPNAGRVSVARPVRHAERHEVARGGCSEGGGSERGGRLGGAAAAQAWSGSRLAAGHACGPGRAGHGGLHARGAGRRPLSAGAFVCWAGESCSFGTCAARPPPPRGGPTLCALCSLCVPGGADAGRRRWPGEPRPVPLPLPRRRLGASPGQPTHAPNSPHRKRTSWQPC